MEILAAAMCRRHRFCVTESGGTVAKFLEVVVRH